MSLIPSVGARKLAEAGTIESIAEKCGVSPRAVTSWRSGAKVPNASSRHTIERVYPHIAPRDWDRVEMAAPPAAAASPSAPLLEGDTEGASAEGRLRAQMARLREMRQGQALTERARIEVERLELQASVRLARIEGQELSTRKILASALWGQLQRLINEALDPHPLALFELEAAIARASGGEPGGHMGWATSDFPQLVEAVRAANAALSEALATRAARIRSGAA